MSQHWLVRCKDCNSMMAAPEVKKVGTLIDCYKCGRSLDATEGFWFKKPTRVVKEEKYDLLKVL